MQRPYALGIDTGSPRSTDPRRPRSLKAAPDLSVRHRTVHGYRRAYRMCGEGPPLLLLHGIGDRSDAWLPVIAALAADFTVIAPDLLGHGESDKPRADYSIAAFANGMRDLLDVLGIDQVTVVGHSLGGGVAAQFAYQYPERCERLVLVASGGVAREVTPLLRLATAPLAEIVLPLMQLPLVRLGGVVALEAVKRLGTNLGQDADDLRRVFDALPDRRARIAFTRTLRSGVDWRGQVITMLDRSYLAAAMPTMLVWGKRDSIIPVAHAYRAHAAMAGSRLEVFDEAGHFPHHTDPARFLEILTDFIATTEPMAHDRDRWRSLLRSGADSTAGAPDEPLEVVS